uniref:DUF3421 domain-containing protein n=1 Tax=Anopheles atroparvus TaxID=41427 RepID=A0AAG5D8L7_ANOAO
MGNPFYDCEGGHGEAVRMSQNSIYEQLVRRDRVHRMEWVETRSQRCKLPPGWKNKFFLARATHEGSWTPGYLDVTKKICTIVWGGKAHKKDKCEILCTGGSFVPCTDTNTLLRATAAGMSEEGEPLYFGRVKQNGRYVYGKVQRSHGVCYVPLYGKETPFKEYQIFVKSSPKPETTEHAAVADLSEEATYAETDAKELRAFLARPAPGNSAKRHELYTTRMSNPPVESWEIVFDAERLPRHAVLVDWIREPGMYIGRSRHEGSITPGFAIPESGACHIVWGGREWIKENYEILCDYNGVFVRTHGDVIPEDALLAGESELGEALYIGRVMQGGRVLVGKVQPSHGGCYVPIDGREVLFANYEIYICP